MEYYIFNTKREAMEMILEINLAQNIPSGNNSVTNTYCNPIDIGDGTWGVMKDSITQKQEIEGTPIIIKVDLDDEGLV